ncbi:unnamed protein product [Schistosoma rodhaini]|nr:unnamed protein product [Schistosoma rodhaini]
MRRHCPRLAKMSVRERRQEIRRRGLCYLCLRKGHIAMSCNSGFKCDVENCKVRHNSLLHIDGTDNYVMNLAKDVNSSRVCLGIVPVRLYGPKGCLETYALLDSGSDTSLACEELINQLGIKGKETSIRVATVNGTTNCECLEVDLEVFSLDERGSIRINKVYTTKKLPIDHAAPLTEPQLKRWKHLKDITLPRLQSNFVGVLMGCDAPDAHWVLEQRLGDRKHPFAVRTHLGWMIIGPKGAPRSLHQVQWCHCSNDILRDIERLYNHEFEDTDTSRNGYSVEDKRALEIVSKSFKLEGDHFQVGLPWKYDRPSLPNNLELAERRLECLRKRFMKDNSLLQKYQAVMNKHLSKSYIIEASKEGFDRDAVCWYIPHHPVINPKKPGKLRIVFDCAAVYQGFSLNDQLLRGPNTVNSLLGVLLRFRLGNLALAADIEEMFLQVRIPRQDRGAFRLLWWEDGDIKRTAKARVSLLKVQTIPRLELTAAVLAARMESQLQSELDIKFAEVKFWTDSTIVLHYIRNEKSQFKTFIANRISTIHSLTKVDQWRFVPSKENIADFASRGVKFNIDDVKVWEEGPRFLKKPKECWPAVNIQGPEPHLSELKKAMSTHVMVEESTVGIDWHFSPPAASHWGGVWERVIRSVRRVLGALVKEQPLTDECLETFMIEAERIINNRPLVPVTDDSSDLDAITPAKLLLLRENVTELTNVLSNDRYSKRWKQANYLAQVFWRRWSKEYVSPLQRRYKWTQLERNIREGDLVMICSEFSEKNKWPLGLVQRVLPSKDGLVRQVELRTRKGILVRDIRKLCLLEAIDGR